MRFVLTGPHPHLTRAQLSERLAAYGDRVVDSFSNGADALVASRSDTSKATQARALGKPVWTYAQLDAYLSGRRPSAAASTASSAPIPASSAPPAEASRVAHPVLSSGRAMRL